MSDARPAKIAALRTGAAHDEGGTGQRDAAALPVVRARLDLAYRGTDFAGWASQPGLRTVQGVLEDALALVLRTGAEAGQRPRLTVAGRTDAGVHARGQVAHVDIAQKAWERLPGRSDRTPATALLDRLNGVLPTDIVVRDATIAPDGFDARFSALWRRYAYRISDDLLTRDPLTADWTLAHRGRLDVPAMNDAAAALIGLHDFGAFCRPREGATTIRTLTEFRWERASSGPDAGLVVAHVQADAFCHSMVRALVGSSLAVGTGRRPPAWMAEVLASGQRSQAAAVAPALGLTLEQVAYPPDAALAARAEAVRAKRSSDEVRSREQAGADPGVISASSAARSAGQPSDCC